jgi:hypothetical protein
MRGIILLVFAAILIGGEAAAPVALPAPAPSLADLVEQFPQRIPVGQAADRPVAIFLGKGSVKALYIVQRGEAWSTTRTQHYNVLGMAAHEVEGLVVLETMPVPKDRRPDPAARARIYWIRLADGINMLCVGGRWEVYVDPVKLEKWPVPEAPGSP